MTTAKAFAAFLPALALVTAVQADDTDIYLSGGGSLGGKPLVMFTLDYRPNLGSSVCGGSECDSLRTTVSPTSGTTYLPSSGSVTRFQMLRAVLRKVTDDMATELADVKVGIMLNHNDTVGGQCGAGPSGNCSNGAYVLMGFDTNKNTFHNKLANIPVPQGNLAHSFQGKELYFELFRYLTGQGVYNGHKGYEDFGDDDDDDNLDVDNPRTSFDDTLLKWDTAIETNAGAQYVSPLIDECSKVFVINFLFQVSNQESESDSAIRANKASGGLNGYNPGTSNAAFANVIRWMRDADLADGTYGTAGNLEDTQNVTSYFFVEPTKINTTTNGYASAGGTNTALALSDDPETLISQLKDVFKQILSISTTFVSAAVPVNVFNRVETLENVFFALFQPEQVPRWNGNLKRLKLAQDDISGNLRVLDATTPGIEAISATDGRIKNEALTFWTHAGGFDVQSADTAEGEVAGKDGRSVGRGGAGQRIPGFIHSDGTQNTNGPALINSASGARQLFTEPDSFTNGTAIDLRALNADDTTASAVWSQLKLNGADGASSWSAADSYSSASTADQTTALSLLKFARGVDVYDEDQDGNVTEAHPWAIKSGKPRRPWLMADPLHSKPTPVNYGARPGFSTTVPDIRILVAGNDGFLHMFRNSASGSLSTESPDGPEVWAFLPRQLLGNLKPLADNAAATPHVYGLDGTAVVYMDDIDGDGTIERPDQDGKNDRVYAYIGMRRGGKAYYALDISDPDTPKMLWSIAKNDATGDFGELGLTFSDPVVGQLNWDMDNPNAEPKSVVIFAGGYDTNKDLDSTTNSNNAADGPDDTEGRGIYIVDAATGHLVWKAVHGDNTGNVNSTTYERGDLDDSIPSTVTAVDTDADEKIDRIYVGDTGGVIWRADLAGSDTSKWTLKPALSVGRHASLPDRRFFHRPGFVPARDTSKFDAVIIGSGDREHPLDSNTQNQFYVFKDRATTSGSPPTTTLTPSNLDNLTNSTNVTKPDGWYIDLGTSSSGEKALASPLTYFGKVYFSTYSPFSGATPAGECGPSEGSAYSYVVNLFNGAGVFSFDSSNDGDGITNERSVVSGAGIPSDPVFISLNGKQYITPGNIPTEEVFRTPLSAHAIWKTYWYEQD